MSVLWTHLIDRYAIVLTLYHRIPTFSDLEKDAFWKHCVKRRKCWWPAFSPFHTMFSNLPKINFNFSVTFYFVILQILSIWTIVKIFCLVKSYLRIFTWKSSTCRQALRVVCSALVDFAGPYLIVITKKEKVGQIQGHSIWKVTGTEFHSYKRTTLHLTEKQVFMCLLCIHLF